jgi:large subunit ribosomal protein L22
MATTTTTPGARATARYLHVSPYKVRQVLQLVRGLPYEDAERVLHLCEKDAADPVLKLLGSAASNAEHNHSLPVDELFVAAAWADEGPTRKWGQPRARGRYFRIRKRTSHVTIVLERFSAGELEIRRRREEATGRGAAAAQRRRAERVRRSRQRTEAAQPAAEEHDHDHLEEALAEEQTMAQEEALAAEGEYPGGDIETEDSAAADEPEETQAEPTEGEAEPESTSGRETQAEPTGGEAEPESTSGQETHAEPTEGEAQPESTNEKGEE